MVLKYKFIMMYIVDKKKDIKNKSCQTI